MVARFEPGWLPHLGHLGLKRELIRVFKTTLPPGADSLSMVGPSMA
jgi:hypothetical protein